MKQEESLCNWEVVLFTNWKFRVHVNILEIQFNRLKVEWILYELVHCRVMLIALVRTWCKSRKKCVEPIVLYFQLTWNPQYIYGKHTQLVSANLRLFPDIACLSETFLRHIKVWVKTEIKLKGLKIFNLSLAWKEKSSNYAQNNCNSCEILSGMCPLFLQMAQINFNSWLIHLSGIFSQIYLFLTDLRETQTSGDFETNLSHLHLWWISPNFYPIGKSKCINQANKMYDSYLNLRELLSKASAILFFSILKRHGMKHCMQYGFERISKIVLEGRGRLFLLNWVAY